MIGPIRRRPESEPFGVEGERPVLIGWPRIRQADRSALQPVPRPEDPPDQREAQDEEPHRRREADLHAHVRGPVEAPAEAADQVDHRVEQAEGAPGIGQHVDRIERAAEEGERGDDQHRDELQLLEALRPDADDEAEQAEGRRGEHQEGDHQSGVQDADRHEEGRRREDDEAQDHRLGGRRADVAEDHFLGRRRHTRAVRQRARLQPACAGALQRRGAPDARAAVPLHHPRPAIANERLQCNRAGQVVLRLKSAYKDGTPHIVMSPLEFMQRLAALVPRPRLHLIPASTACSHPMPSYECEIVPREPANDPGADE